MINEHCRFYKVICLYKFSDILKILKSARRFEAPLAVTSHLGQSLVLHPRFFYRQRFGLGWSNTISKLNIKGNSHIVQDERKQTSCESPFGDA